MKNKITIRFKHDAKSKLKYVSPSTFFFDEDSSTGPVIDRGVSVPVLEVDVRRGDVIEFATTPFTDEFDIRVIRRGKVVNQAKPLTRAQRARLKKRRLSHSDEVLTKKGAAKK